MGTVTRDREKHMLKTRSQDTIENSFSMKFEIVKVFLYKNT